MMVCLWFPTSARTKLVNNNHHSSNTILSKNYQNRQKINVKVLDIALLHEEHMLIVSGLDIRLVSYFHNRIVRTNNGGWVGLG